MQWIIFLFNAFTPSIVLIFLCRYAVKYMAKQNVETWDKFLDVKLPELTRIRVGHIQIRSDILQLEQKLEKYADLNNDNFREFQTLTRINIDKIYHKMMTLEGTVKDLQEKDK